MIFKSLMKSASVALILAMVTGSVAMAGEKAAKAGEKAAKHHVVFHVNSDEKSWGMAMNNISIMKKNLGDKVEIEVVANGPGLGMLKFDSPVGQRLGKALDAGVTAYACGNTMKAMKVSDKDLYPGVKVVPGGIMEVVKKQEAGWSYIKI